VSRGEGWQARIREGSGLSEGKTSASAGGRTSRALSPCIPTTTMSINPTSVGRLADVVRLKSTVLQRPYNPLNLRTGIRYLTDPLIGPAVNSWYPVQMHMRMFRPALQDDTLNAPDVERWQQRLEWRRAKGKLAPKKGKFTLFRSLSFPCVLLVSTARMHADRLGVSPLLSIMFRSGKKGDLARQGKEIEWSLVLVRSPICVFLLTMLELIGFRR
jgi:small subunit ribosomal protein S33